MKTSSPPTGEFHKYAMQTYKGQESKTHKEQKSRSIKTDPEILKMIVCVNKDNKTANRTVPRCSEC